MISMGGVRMRDKKIIASIICASMLAGMTGCTSAPKETTVQVEATENTTIAEETTTAAEVLGGGYLEGYPAFAVTSANLNNGVWDDIISNTNGGENASPELSWEPVEGAALYVIYMVDMNTNGFLHWKSDGVKETSLPQGWAPSKEYVGPYPAPGDTHVYDIYVVALKAPVERLKGGNNAINPKMEAFIKELDIDSDGNSDNIVAYGRISGKFTT